MEVEMEMEASGAMMSPVLSSSTSAVMAAAAATATASEDEGDLRRGPWTVEEDMLLVDYIARHGEGRWNSLARCAGLKRTGKSCRLRWLNYLRPDVRRGNITPEEQLLILDLHSRWGNRWSKIAQQLPGRTDNEIKNYWRTRVQKHAKQLRCDVNSTQFRHLVRHIWMPRLLERIHAGGDGDAPPPDARTTVSSPGARPQTTSTCAYQSAAASNARHHVDYYTSNGSQTAAAAATSPDDITSTFRAPSHGACRTAASTTTNNAAAGAGDACDDVINDDAFSGSWSELLAATGLPELEFGEFDDTLWGLEDICYSSSADERWA